MIAPDATIALIGPMGSGKSTVGKHLSELLARPLFDTDQMIEASEGRSVQEVFELDSEEVFRQKEVVAVRAAAATKSAVIACGGGAVLEAENVELLREKGVVIYLEVDAQIAASRVGDGGKRPLLAGGAVEKKLVELIAARAPLYHQSANFSVSANGLPGDVAAEIMSCLEGMDLPQKGNLK